MKILITGISGFVGTNLVKTLSESHTIFGITTSKDKIVDLNIKDVFEWNDLYSDNIPDVDAIIHLAGKAHDTKNSSNANVYFEVNTELTQKVYDYFLNHNVSKFIYFSSVKAVADSVEGVLTEESEPKPIGPYGESKIAAEKYILSKKLQEDKSAFILRPCMIHGEGNKGNLNLLYKLVSKGIPWPLGAFENQRSFASIDNVCFVVGEILTKNITDGIYNIADDKTISTNELIEIISKCTDKKSRILKINKKFMLFCAKVGSFIKLPLNTQTINKLTESYIVSNKKIKSALYIDDMPMNAIEGLNITIKSFNKIN